MADEIFIGRNEIYDLYCELLDHKLPAGLSLSRFFDGMGFRIYGFYFGQLLVSYLLIERDCFELTTVQNYEVFEYNDDNFCKGEAHFSSCEELIKICLSLTTPQQVASQE